ncbi:hypothetical protein CRUP_026750 [Coryphaenoides rupestris]|nr:hypothetical protein CRUP_026750 [Coryphaenoides rupestris]
MIQLVLCVFAATDHRRDVSAFAPLAAGSSVVVGHLAGRAGVTAGVLYDHLLCPRSEPLCERARAPWGCEDCKVDDGGARSSRPLLADCRDAVESKHRL